MITSKDGRLEHQAGDSEDYVWQFGARKLAEYLAGGPKPRFSPEHAVHVVEIMEAVKRSQAEGERISVAQLDREMLRRPEQKLIWTFLAAFLTGKPQRPSSSVRRRTSQIAVSYFRRERRRRIRDTEEFAVVAIPLGHLGAMRS